MCLCELRAPILWCWWLVNDVRCVWSELRWLGSLIGGRVWCFHDRTPLSTACSWGPKTPTSWRATTTTWPWILGMRSVELCQEIGIEYAISWDPWSFLGAIPLPVHQIFQFTPTMSGTQDLLYRVDRSILQHYWVAWHTSWVLFHNGDQTMCLCELRALIGAVYTWSLHAFFLIGWLSIWKDQV